MQSNNPALRRSAEFSFAANGNGQAGYTDPATLGHRRARPARQSRPRSPPAVR